MLSHHHPQSDVPFKMHYVLQGCHSPCLLPLRDVPFGMHHVLQGCHSLTCISLRDVPFRMHHVLQGCDSPTCIYFAWCALKDAPRPPRVSLANLCFFCATCPSGCTTCSKGATRWFDGLVDSITPRVNTPPGESCGRLRALRNKAPALLRAP